MMVVCICSAAMVAGCASPRPERSEVDMQALRQRSDERDVAEMQTFLRDAVRHMAEEQQQAKAAGSAPATYDVLIISGGGDWGAFGAGVLKGWGRIAEGAFARPAFDIVTGVSTGALIAPFAYLGEDSDYERIVHLYRNPQKDWVKPRGIFYFLPSNLSFATVPGLEREVREQVDQTMVQRIAEAGKSGRSLLVNTTNIDEGGMRVWDVVAESRKSLESGDIDRVHQILLASSGIPGAFPSRMVDGEMYVDGAMTGNVLYGARMREEDTLPAVWDAAYPGATMPLVRYWIIFNNKVRPTPMTVEPTWPSVIARSVETSSRFATITAIRHLYAMAEISRLKRHAQFEVRMISVPTDWSPPKPGVFVHETMNELADLGERLGSDPASWSEQSP